MLEILSPRVFRRSTHPHNLGCTARCWNNYVYQGTRQFPYIYTGPTSSMTLTCRVSKQWEFNTTPILGWTPSSESMKPRAIRARSIALVQIVDSPVSSEVYIYAGSILVKVSCRLHPSCCCLLLSWHRTSRHRHFWGFSPLLLLLCCYIRLYTIMYSSSGTYSARILLPHLTSYYYIAIARKKQKYFVRERAPKMIYRIIWAIGAQYVWEK